VSLIVVATSAAACSTAETLSATAASAGRIRLGFRLVNLQRPTPQFLAIQGRDRLVRFPSVGHFHKGETSGTSSFAIRNDADPVDCPVRFEYATQFRFGGAVR
jgi:hypothetical protein